MFLLKFKNISLAGFALALGFLTAGCQSVPLKGGVNDQGEKIYLSSGESIPKTIETFSKSQDLNNEESKINYLISRLQKSKFTYVRNRANYSGMEAAEFLRWKLNRPRWRPLISTAQDFVIIITRGSITSGLPYEVVMPNGDRHDLKALLINELEFLNKYLEEKNPPILRAVKSESAQPPPAGTKETTPLTPPATANAVKSPETKPAQE